MPKILFSQDHDVVDGDGVILKSFRAGQVSDLSAASCRHHVARRRATFVSDAEAAAAAQELAASASADKPPSGSADGISASAAAKALAAEKGVDLTQVAGTGKDGAVTKGDVETYLASAGADVAPPPAEEQDPPADDTARLQGL